MSGFPKRLLVTGTDTEIGKTIVSAGLVAWLRGQGVNAAGWKPVESGASDSGAQDASLLHAVSGGTEADELPVVYLLPEPLAPVVAARRHNVALVPAVLDVSFGAASAGCDVLVVEGVGGALVEVAEGLMVADLPQRWDVPVVVVAANRLGVLSHTLLTVEALQTRGATVLGVVLNTVHGGEPTLAEATNPAELRRLLPRRVPLLGHVPFIEGESRRDAGALAAALADVGGALWETA